MYFFLSILDRTKNRDPRGEYRRFYQTRCETKRGEEKLKSIAALSMEKAIRPLRQFLEYAFPVLFSALPFGLRE